MTAGYPRVGAIGTTLGRAGVTSLDAAAPAWPTRGVNVLEIAAAGLLHGQLAAVLLRGQAGEAPALLFANAAFTRLTGYGEAEVIGRPFSFLNGPDTAAEMIGAFNRAITARAFDDLQILQYRCDGGAFWNGMTVIPAGDQDGPLFLVLMRDVTAHHRAEDRLMALTDRLRDLAMSDPLTGVGNRRSFDDVLEVGWQRARRSGRWITLAMIDIDHFKRFNDRFGHPAGDACLKAVARALDRVIRQPTDFLARYGGEEFAILMPDMEAQAAAAMADRLVEAVRGAECGPAFSAITISCGIASAIPEPDGAGPAQLLQEADRALYWAKEAGRDCMRQIRA